MQKPLEYRKCFVCGRDSNIGLKVQFELTKKGANAKCIIDDRYEGFKGLVHGGVLSALLDEVMWKSINGLTGAVTMTAKMEVKFKKPVATGVPLVAEGFIVSQRRKLYEAGGVILDPEGNVMVEATGTFIRLDEQNSSRMTEDLE